MFTRKSEVVCDGSVSGSKGPTVEQVLEGGASLAVTEEILCVLPAHLGAEKSPRAR